MHYIIISRAIVIAICAINHDDDDDSVCFIYAVFRKKTPTHVFFYTSVENV